MNHGDTKVLHMVARRRFTKDKVGEMIKQTVQDIGCKSEYIISDQAHNLVNGIAISDMSSAADISYAMGRS